MKTIKEINEIAPYHPCEWQQGYGIWQAGYMEGQKGGATEQKAIDNKRIEELLEYLKELEAHYRDLGQYDDGKPIRRVIEYIKSMEE